MTHVELVNFFWGWKSCVNHLLNGFIDSALSPKIHFNENNSNFDFYKYVPLTKVFVLLFLLGFLSIPTKNLYYQLKMISLITSNVLAY